MSTRRCEAAALGKGLGSRLAHPLHCLDAQFRDKRQSFCAAEIVGLEVAVLEAVFHETQQLGHNGLGSLPLQYLDQIVVCQGHVLDEDLAHNAHTILPGNIPDRQGVKFLDHLPDIALVLTEAEALLGQ